MNKKTISIIVGVIVLCGVIFYGGIKYGQSSRGNFANLSPADRQARFGAAGSMGGARGMRSFGGSVAGEIIARDDKSITVKLTDGGSRIVFLTSSTTIAKSISGSADDLKMGTDVVINGTANPDGSVTAGMLQIRNPQPNNK